MPRGSDDRPDDAELLRRFTDQLTGMSVDDLRSLLPEVMGPFGSRVGGVAERVPSRRRPRRADVVTFRVRCDLTGTKPPLWRRLELASDMPLDELHTVLQTSFGWTDSHLHRFGSGTRFWDLDTEHYLCPFDVQEGETGIPESDVRLDEVLVDPDDVLHYVYDFGDGWQHRLRLEAVLSRDGSAMRAVCTGGRRPGAPEDVGGVGGYEMHSAATDPTHPDHAAARAEFADAYGPDLDPAALGGTPFDIEAINRGLAGRGTAALPVSGLPEPVADLLLAVRDPRESVRLGQLIGRAFADEPTNVDVDVAAGMVRPYAWLLDRVGEAGIALTSAGYLPPAHVEAAVAELGLGDEWIGKHNREVQTRPVLELRESAQKAGLLRRSRGTLLLTAPGKRLRDDPVGLWWHLAERLPPISRDACANQAGLLLLICLAADPDGGEDLDGTVARILSGVGWMLGNGGPLTEHHAFGAARETWVVLHRLGALTPRRYPERERVTPEGVAFARAALTSWPEKRRPTR